MSGGGKKKVESRRVDRHRRTESPAKTNIMMLHQLFSNNIQLGTRRLQRIFPINLLRSPNKAQMGMQEILAHCWDRVSEWTWTRSPVLFFVSLSLSVCLSLCLCFGVGLMVGVCGWLQLAAGTPDWLRHCHHLPAVRLITWAASQDLCTIRTNVKPTSQFLSCEINPVLETQRYLCSPHFWPWFVSFSLSGHLACYLDVLPTSSHLLTWSNRRRLPAGPPPQIRTSTPVKAPTVFSPAVVIHRRHLLQAGLTVVSILRKLLFVLWVMLVSDTYI